MAVNPTSAPVPRSASPGRGTKQGGLTPLPNTPPPVPTGVPSSNNLNPNMLRQMAARRLRGPR